MKLIVGLGNPDLKYVFTRHNTGFLAIDELLRRLGKTKEIFLAELDEEYEKERTQERQDDHDFI